MVSTITLCEGGGVNIPDLCHALICPHALQCWGGGREDAPVFLPKEKSVLIVITFGKGSQISTAKYNKRHPSPRIGGHGSVKAHVATHHSLRRRPHAHACWPAMIWHGAGTGRCPVRVISMSKCVVVYISPHVINSNGEKKVWRADADAPSHVAPHLVRMAAPVNQTAAVVRKPPRPVNLHDSLSSLSLNYGAGFIPQLICTWIQLVTYSSSQQSVHHSPSAGGEGGEGGLLQILNHIHIWWLILSLAGLSKLMCFPYWIM